MVASFSYVALSLKGSSGPGRLAELGAEFGSLSIQSALTTRARHAMRSTRQPSGVERFSMSEHGLGGAVTSCCISSKRFTTRPNAPRWSRCCGVPTPESRSAGADLWLDPAANAQKEPDVRNFKETTITTAVLERLGQAVSGRPREVGAAVVRHLHAFVQEIEPTEAEWAWAVEFLTRTGQACSDTRQEFILLSDTLGISMLVDAIKHRLPDNATETTVLGPFYLQAAPEHAFGDDISGEMAGEPLLVEARVHGTNGQPIATAVVDTWHTDSDGFYGVLGHGGPQRPAGRARLRTDEQGRFWFRSIFPASYPIPDDGPVGDMLEFEGRHPYRPAHIHFMVGPPGHETLVRHVFPAGDPYLDSDVVFGVKYSLVRALERQEPEITARGNPVDRPAAALRDDFVLADAHLPDGSSRCAASR